jgi:prepilin-type N-terminal cleavage/methylation domain-containing protein
MEHPPMDQKGFSFMEVVIALAVFSIAIVALYGLQTRTITQNFAASRITTANTWASEKLEVLMALKYDDVKTATVSEKSPDGVYTVLWNVIEETPLPNTKTVRVVVTSPRGGTGNRVELEYIKHDTM